MIHVKKGINTHKRHKKIKKHAKGYRGISKGQIRLIYQRMEKGLQYSYMHSKHKKRFFRRLWIQRINAAAREHGISYSKLINMLKKNDIEINRKMLSDIAVNEPFAFKAVINKVINN